MSRLWWNIASAVLGLATVVLLFSIGGTSQCVDGEDGGSCISWSDSILVRYEGENGAIGMGIALASGIAVACAVKAVQRFAN